MNGNEATIALCFNRYFGASPCGGSPVRHLVRRSEHRSGKIDMKFAKRVGLIAGGIGFFAAFLGGADNASYDAGYAFVDGLVGGAFWFGIAYGITRLVQRNKNGKQ